MRPQGRKNRTENRRRKKRETGNGSLTQCSWIMKENAIVGQRMTSTVEAIKVRELKKEVLVEVLVRIGELWKEAGRHY